MDCLVTEINHQVTITNSDIELSGVLLHINATSRTFDIRERTCLIKTDNLATFIGNEREMPQPRKLQPISFVYLEITNNFIATFLDMIICMLSLIHWLMNYLDCSILQPIKSLTTYNLYYRRQMVINISTRTNK